MTRFQPTPLDISQPVLTILGEPISKQEYNDRRKSIAQGFMATHPAKVRTIVDMISKLTLQEIDERTACAHNAAVDKRLRSRAAFEILAWNVIVRPFAHPKRAYVFNPDSYIDLVNDDEQYLYMFAVLLLKKPQEYIYKRLKTLHAESAKVYRDYCRDYTVAEHEYDSIEWMFNW